MDAKVLNPQMKGQVRPGQDGSHVQATEGASEEPSPASPVLDVQAPELRGDAFLFSRVLWRLPVLPAPREAPGSAHTCAFPGVHPALLFACTDSPFSGVSLQDGDHAWSHFFLLSAQRSVWRTHQEHPVRLRVFWVRSCSVRPPRARGPSAPLSASSHAGPYLAQVHAHVLIPAPAGCFHLLEVWQPP